MQIFSSQGATGVTGNSAAGTGVTGAIRNAASATGTSFEYLLTTARVESNLNPQASAKTSSAKGLFQFIDSTWLATVKTAGPSLGYGKLADAITQNSDGSLSVADPAMRQQISDLRNDPQVSAAMAGAFTSSNAAQLTDKLGRKPTDGELYIAHFMGANGAAKLINAASSGTETPAASLFPKAAEANRSIFYDKQGAPRSASEVYANLTHRYDVARAGNGTAVAAVQSAQTATAVTAQALAPASTVAVSNNVSKGPLFHNMFSGAERQGAPVSQVIRDLWATRPHVAAALSGQVAPTSGVQSAQALTPVTRNSMTETLRDLYGNARTNVRSLFTGVSSS
jgi:hypothetical protein